MWACTAGWLNVLNSEFLFFDPGVNEGMPFLMLTTCVITAQKHFFGYRFINNCFNTYSGIRDYYDAGGDAADVRDAAQGRPLTCGGMSSPHGCYSSSPPFSSS